MPSCFFVVAVVMGSAPIHCVKTEAVPGFPVGGGANPPGGRQHMILPNFAKNCMKLRKFWATGGGRSPGAPPRNPPLQDDCEEVYFVLVAVTVIGH